MNGQSLRRLNEGNPEEKSAGGLFFFQAQRE
jgi:hypothetical protein